MESQDKDKTSELNNEPVISGYVWGKLIGLLGCVAFTYLTSSYRDLNVRAVVSAIFAIVSSQLFFSMFILEKLHNSCLKSANRSE